MDKEFTVERLSGDTWQVIQAMTDDDGMWVESYPVHQGSLADCEAYIRLTEGGYM